MKYWEFLIQKEGDQTWLPLATQQVELPAGRYCIVAHTDRANTPLAIRLSSLVPNGSAYQQARQRNSHTNEAGLALVMPYRYLEPGEWQLDCSNFDLTNGSVQSDWRYSLQLRVSARAEGGSGSRSATVIAPVPIEAVTDPTLLNGDLPLMQAQTEIGHWVAEPSPALESIGHAYQVSLSQRAYLARHNQLTTIIGKVKPAEAVELAAPEESELWIRLQDPQTAQTVLEAHRPLSLAGLPADFKVQIQLPAEVTSQVVVGEVSLRTAPTPETPAQLLTSQVFTITAGIDYLLDAITYQDTDDFQATDTYQDTVAYQDTDDFEEAHYMEATAIETTVSLTEYTNGTEPAVSPLLNPVAKAITPAVGVLPPQLNRAEKPAYSLAASQLELPTLPKPAEPPLPPQADSVVTAPPAVTQPAQFIGTSILDDDLEADEITAALDRIGLDSIELDANNSDDTDSPDSETAKNFESHDANPSIDSFASPSSPAEQLPQAPSKANVDFQSLQLKSHFWQRLSTLTHESHREATKMAEGMKAAGISQEQSFAVPAELAPPLEEEVVIFDELPATASQPIEAFPETTGPLADEDTYSPAYQSQLSVTDEASPEMSPPIISLPAGDLIAGELIIVTVRTGPSSYRPFIKLWMIDRQSRSLVMEPQRLTNLLPDALGDLRATATLQVPLGCLDVQIAAIAIDMATQQESSKAVVNRHVIPAEHASQLRSFNSR